MKKSDADIKKAMEKVAQRAQIATLNEQNLGLMRQVLKYAEVTGAVVAVGRSVVREFLADSDLNEDTPLFTALQGFKDVFESHITDPSGKESEDAEAVNGASDVEAGDTPASEDAPGVESPPVEQPTS